ncbi:hypothetical protein T492DRAFT_850721, partial [Pavlovales sp. CCMP2436]
CGALGNELGESDHSDGSGGGGGSHAGGGRGGAARDAEVDRSGWGRRWRGADEEGVGKNENENYFSCYAEVDEDVREMSTDEVMALSAKRGLAEKPTPLPSVLLRVGVRIADSDGTPHSLEDVRAMRARDRKGYHVGSLRVFALGFLTTKLQRH